MGGKKSITSNLGVYPISSTMASASIEFRCYKKDPVTVTLLIENARIESESTGKVYKLNNFNGKHEISTK